MNYRKQFPIGAKIKYSDAGGRATDTQDPRYRTKYGIIVSHTHSLLVINRDNPLYRGQQDTIAFHDLICGAVHCAKV